MPTLDWIGKSAVVGHHKQVPYRLIKCDKDFSAGEAGEGNLLVEGDNLHALKALLPYYGGKVKCIYIDPPYNTGNEGWIYNDNVNAPEIKKWLGQVVGKEAEDLSRHDKWLCMMYPRIRLLWDFLTDDGVLFVSINDIEGSALEMICKEIFGPRNLLARLIWNTEGNTDNQLEIKINHEYVLMFLKDMRFKEVAVGSVIDPNTREDSNLWKGIADNNINKNNPANPPDVFTIPIGFPSAEKELFYRAKVVDEEFFNVTKNQGFISKQIKSKYEIENLSGLPIKLDDLVIKDFKVQLPCRIYGGFANRRKLDQFVNAAFKPVEDDGGPIRFYINRNAAIRYHREVVAASNILSVLRNLGTTERMRTELRNMGVHFDYPKPVALIKYLLSIGAASKDSIVMDCFAGSGTTGHAVLLSNEKGEANRKFILVELNGSIARDVIAKRLRLVSAGYKGEAGETLPGLGSGFRYCTLAEPLFDERGQIAAAVKFADLAHHVFFTETGEPMPKRPDKRTPLLGVHKGRAVYLLFNGILDDKQPRGGNVLTNDVLKLLPPHDGPRVIYGTACRLSANRLKREGVTFRQIPYEIKTD